MKNSTYKTNINYELERVFDVEDTYNDHDFFEAVSRITEEYYTDKKDEHISTFAEKICDWMSEVQNGEMTESGFVSSVYELMES